MIDMSEHNYLGTKFKAVMVDREILLPAEMLKKLFSKFKAVASELSRKGFFPGRTGNISSRFKNGFFITAAGSELSSLKNDDIVFVESVDEESFVVKARGKKQPSSESFLHSMIYSSRSDVKAIIHAHSQKIVSQENKCALLGIPVTEREMPYGTLELAKAVCSVLDKHDFVVIKSHGIIAMGRDLFKAKDVLEKKSKLF